jgi:hypothetical protein
MTGRRDSRPWRKRQVQSVEVRQTRSRFSVVRTDNKPRTQNGHIRNDTRDVLRRISGPSNGAICRRMCVARDRACTRMTLQNLHGKEGVDGSSPSEGLPKVPANRHFVVVCFDQQADTFRTHLRYGRRTVTSHVVFRRIRRAWHEWAKSAVVPANPQRSLPEEARSRSLLRREGIRRWTDAPV